MLCTWSCSEKFEPKQKFESISIGSSTTAHFYFKKIFLPILSIDLRIIKETSMYAKELTQIANRIEKMKSEGKDEYDIRKMVGKI
jgi:hypothetical protein